MSKSKGKAKKRETKAKHAAKPTKSARLAPGAEKARKEAERAAAEQRVHEQKAREEAEAKRKAAIPKGLVEVEVIVQGSPFVFLEPRPGLDYKDLTVEQRAAIGAHLNAIGSKLPRYVDKRALAIVAEEAEKREAHRKAEAAVRIAKMRERLGDTDPKVKRPSAIARSLTQLNAKKADGGAAPSRATRQAKKLAQPLTVPVGGFTKANCPPTSGELIRARIMERRLEDEAIAAEVRKLFEGRTTAVSDVRWNRAQMTKAGLNPPPPVGEDKPAPARAARAPKVKLEEKLTREEHLPTKAARRDRKAQRPGKVTVTKPAKAKPARKAKAKPTKKKR